MAYLPLYARRKLAGNLTGVYWTPPVITYLALFSNVPDENTPGIFIADAGFQPVSWQSQLDGTRTNGNAITFGPATDGWGTVRAVGLFDSYGGAANLLWAEEVEPVEVEVGNEYQIDPGQLVVSIGAVDIELTPEEPDGDSFIDPFDGTELGANWTDVTGAGTIIEDGALKSSTGTLMLLDDQDVEDVEAVVQINTGTQPGDTGGLIGLALRVQNEDNLSAFKLLEVFILPRQGSTNVTLRATDYAAPVIQELASIGESNIANADNTSIWLRAVASGNDITFEFWSTDPALGGSPDHADTHTLVGEFATSFGAGVSGKVGLSFNSNTYSSVEEFRMTSNDG